MLIGSSQSLWTDIGRRGATEAGKQQGTDRVRCGATARWIHDSR